MAQGHDWLDYADKLACAVAEADLRAAGFTTPAVDLVAAPTTNTYVRYFTTDRSGRASAEQVAAILARRGIAATIQDFSAGATAPRRPIEIWIGKGYAARSAVG